VFEFVLIPRVQLSKASETVSFLLRRHGRPVVTPKTRTRGSTRYTGIPANNGYPRVSFSDPAVPSLAGPTCLPALLGGPARTVRPSQRRKKLAQHFLSCCGGGCWGGSLEGVRRNNNNHNDTILYTTTTTSTTVVGSHDY
jgi:hypothetical protein